MGLAATFAVSAVDLWPFRVIEIFTALWRFRGEALVGSGGAELSRDQSATKFQIPGNQLFRDPPLL